ncbi:MAG: hypothetical protein AB1782_01410 [Cyanobacteriota bacterium]
MINKVKEKITEILSKIRAKIEANENLSKRFGFVLEKIDSFAKKDHMDGIKRKKRFFKKLKKIFSLKNVSVFLAIMISAPAIVFFAYTYIDYTTSKKIEHLSHNSKIIVNLDYATSFILKRLETTKISKKKVRKLIKVLNGQDSFGRMHKFSPCDRSILAFGERPQGGIVTIDKKFEPYGFVITAYNCEVEPLAEKFIKLKRPKFKKKKTKKSKVKGHGINESTHTSQHGNKSTNTNETHSNKVTAPSETTSHAGHSSTNEKESHTNTHQTDSKEEKHNTSSETKDNNHQTKPLNNEGKHETSPEKHDNNHQTKPLNNEGKHETSPENHDNKHQTDSTQKDNKSSHSKSADSHVDNSKNNDNHSKEINTKAEKIEQKTEIHQTEQHH